MSDIYLNYSHTDDRFARRIYDEFEDAEFDVWTDEDFEQGSDTWKTAMRTAIKESECMVVLLSLQAAASDAVEEAVSFARLNHLPIYSVLIEGELKKSKPISLRVDDFYDLRENYDVEVKNLIDDLEALLEGYDEDDEDFYDDDEDFLEDDEEYFEDDEDWGSDIDDDFEDEWDEEEDDFEADEEF